MDYENESMVNVSQEEILHCRNDFFYLDYLLMLSESHTKYVGDLNSNSATTGFTWIIVKYVRKSEAVTAWNVFLLLPVQIYKFNNAPAANCK